MDGQQLKCSIDVTGVSNMMLPTYETKMVCLQNGIVVVSPLTTTERVRVAKRGEFQRPNYGDITTMLIDKERHHPSPLCCNLFFFLCFFAQSSWWLTDPYYTNRGGIDWQTGRQRWVSRQDGFSSRHTNTYTNAYTNDPWHVIFVVFSFLSLLSALA